MSAIQSDVRLTAFPFQVIDYPGGVLLRRGHHQIIVAGTGALEKVLMILSATSGTASTQQEIIELFAVPDRQGMEALITELRAKQFLVPEGLRPIGAREDQFDVFLGQVGAQKQKVIGKLSELRIILGGVNALSHAIFSSLSKMGVENITIFDDPILRGQNYFDQQGDLVDQFHAELKAIILDRPAFRKYFDRDVNGCLVACSDFGGQALLLKWNEFCLHNNIHFLPVYLQDMVGYLGPLVVPGETACLACLRQRQNSHLQDLQLRALVETNATQGQSIVGIHPAAIGTLAQTAVFELTHFFGEMPFPRPGRLIRIDLMAGSTQSKPVLKVPRCPACSKLNRSSEVKISKMNPLKGE